MATLGGISADCDVLIVGGGIAGASLGAELAGKLRAILVEAEPGCGYHATGRSAAFWLESYGGPQVAPLSAASRAFLERPPEDFSDSGFLRQRGAVHIAKTGAAHLEFAAGTQEIDRAGLERLLPGLHPDWCRGMVEPGCADIDVAALHGAYLRRFSRSGKILSRARVTSGRYRSGTWTVSLENGAEVTAAIVINAAGAWADAIARACDVPPLGLAPKRRTMVQLRLARNELRSLPLIIDAQEQFYFKGEGDRSIWLSPHDEIETEPCDAAADEMAVAVAIDRFQQVVDWPIEALERRWAGLRTFAPDRLPVYGFDHHRPSFFWFAGQGGFGIQTAPAAAALAAASVLENQAPYWLRGIDPASYSPARFEAAERARET